MNFINKGSFDKAKKELLNDNNNSVIKVYDELNKSNGPLTNVIFTLKDVFATEDDETTSSSNILLGFRPFYNSTVFQKLIDAGATIIAKVFCDEFAMAGTGTYSRSGIIFNPLDNNRMVGGSSSGSASTFTTNIGFAIGSDTGDSVRLPASYIGKVGFKPSYGAVSRWGLFAYATSLDTVGWFAHNVSDSFVIAKTLYGIDEKDLTSVSIILNELSEIKPKKVLFLDCFDYLDEAISKEYQLFINLLKKNNIEVEKVNINLDLLNAIKPIYDIISFSEASSNLSNLTGVAFGNRVEGKSWEETFSKTRTKGFGFMVQKRLALGSFFLEKDNQEELFLRSQKIRRLINNWYTEIYEKCDIFIFPSSGKIAPLLKDANKNSINFMDWILAGSNFVGSPSINFELGRYENMPFNISIESKIYSDEKLFSYAFYLENIWKKESEK